MAQPTPSLEPITTLLQVNCSVRPTHRVEWSVSLPGVPLSLINTPALIEISRKRGASTELSTAQNREPPLILNGTLTGSSVTVQCTAVDLDNPFSTCPGEVVSLRFYGKHRRENIPSS